MAWGGVVLQALLLGLGLDWLLPLGMLLSGWGLYAFHRAKGHPMGYVVTGTLSAVIPAFGPMLGLCVAPPAPSEAGRPSISYGSWGWLMVGGAILWSICPAREAQMFAAGCLGAALFSFFAWGTQRLGFKRLAPILGVASFGACLGGMAMAPASRDLIRRSAESAGRHSLSELRGALAKYYGDHKGRFPANLRELVQDERYLKNIPLARTGAYHSDSSQVRHGRAADDSGGWLYDPSSGQVLVNCTHTDRKDNVWSSY